MYAVSAASGEMPPELFYEVKSLGSNTKMVMAWEDDGVFRNLTIAYPMFSEHA